MQISPMAALSCHNDCDRCLKHTVCNIFFSFFSSVFPCAFISTPRLLNHICLPPTNQQAGCSCVFLFGASSQGWTGYTLADSAYESCLSRENTVERGGFHIAGMQGLLLCWNGFKGGMSTSDMSAFSNLIGGVKLAYQFDSQLPRKCSHPERI
jgi:hypothetical protein